jgi:hypothetical protein
VGSENDDAPHGRSGAAIWPPEVYGRNAAILARLQPIHYGPSLESSAGLLGLGGVNARIILGADRTERHTARISTALRPLVIEHAVASLREYGQRHTERPQHALEFWSRSKRLTHVAPAKRPFHSVECSTPHELPNRCSLGNLQFPAIALTWCGLTSHGRPSPNSLFMSLAAYDSEFRRWSGGVDRRICQTFAASPAEPGELPLGFRKAGRRPVCSRHLSSRIAASRNAALVRNFGWHLMQKRAPTRKPGLQQVIGQSVVGLSRHPIQAQNSVVHQPSGPQAPSQEKLENN